MLLDFPSVSTLPPSSFNVSMYEREQNHQDKLRELAVDYYSNDNLE